MAKEDIEDQRNTTMGTGMLEQEIKESEQVQNNKWPDVRKNQKTYVKSISMYTAELH